MEKAYAKIFGSYADVRGGYIEDTFKALTGFESMSFLNKYLNDNVYVYTHHKLREGNILSTGRVTHAYSVLDIKEKNNNIFKFKVRNPLSRLKDVECKYNNKNNSTGIFNLKKDLIKDEFREYFKGDLVVCQTLFNSTVYNFRLKSTTPQKIFFSFIIFKKSRISVGMFNEKNEPIFAGILVKYKDLIKNLPYKEIETDNNLKQGILIYL